jgi:hypothetical protein
MNSMSHQVGLGTHICLDCLKMKYGRASERCKACATTEMINRPESRERVNQWHRLRKGVPLKAEHKKNISLALVRIPKNPEHREKIRLANMQRKGIPLELSRREKIRQALTGRQLSLDARHHLSIIRKGIRLNQATCRKMSLAHAGMTLNPDVKQKISGSNNHNWRGGTSREPYSQEFSENLKYYIRKRDDFLCQMPRCYLPENGNHHPVHHIDYDKHNSDHVNLITLCISCHVKTTYGDRDYWTKYLQALQEMRGLNH